VASEAPSDDESEDLEYHDALEEFAAEVECQKSAAAAVTGGSCSAGGSKEQQQQQGVVAVNATASRRL
jgi:hypothetical protein